jgi:hypothetical protein
MSDKHQQARWAGYNWLADSHLCKCSSILLAIARLLSAIAGHVIVASARVLARACASSTHSSGRLADRLLLRGLLLCRRAV